MKNFITLSILLISSATFACDNFTGTYETNEGLQYSLIQNDCNSMKMTDPSSSLTIVFDRKEQLIYDYDLQVGDEVLGHMQVFITSHIEGMKWVYDERFIKTYNDGSIETGKSWAEVFLNEEKNLITLSHKSDGSIATYIDKKLLRSSY